MRVLQNHALSLEFAFVAEQRPTTRQIGFSAYFKGSEYYNAGDRIYFDGRETNIGGHFDNETFTCPIDGLYFFIYTIESDDNDIVVALRIDGNDIARTFHDEADSSDHDQATNSALVTCLAGQEVYLYMYGYDGYVTSSYRRDTTFSGFLVSEN